MKKLTVILIALMVPSLILGAMACSGGGGETQQPTATPGMTSTPTPTSSVSPEVVSVDASYSGTQVNLSVGQLLVVTLDSNPSTGYSWSITMNSDETVLNKMENKYVAPETVVPGAGGKEVWTFKALKTGTSFVSMGYVRPWQTGTPPARSFSLIVAVKE